MIRHSLALCFLLLWLVNCSKNKSNEILTTYDSGNYCGNNGRQDLQDILSSGFYNHVAKIKLVSFKIDTDTLPEDQQVFQRNGVVSWDKMYEVKSLNESLQNQIIDILVNYDHGTKGFDEATCYLPHNGVVFFSGSGEQLGYIEICFDCQGFRFHPNDLPVTGFCNEKFDALKSIFRSAGIQFGLESTMNSKSVEWSPPKI